MLTHIVAHSADPDGILTHAILQRSLGEVQHHFADYDNLTAILEGLVTAKPGNIIVADLSFEEAIAREDLFNNLKQKHSRISWYDHHHGSIERKGFLTQHCCDVVLAANRCAAELVHSVYSPYDLYTEFLAELGHVHDFEQKQNHLAPPAYALQDVIASRYNLNALVSDIAAEKVWKGHDFTPHYQQVLQQFQLLKQEAYFHLEQSVEHTSLAGFSVAVAYSNPLLYMKLAPQHLKERLNDDCIFVLYEGKSNVFVQASPKIGKRILDFVTSNGGGGRGHGGGFMLDHSVAPETYPQDKEDVLRRFAAYFSKYESLR